MTSNYQSSFTLQRIWTNPSAISGVNFRVLKTELWYFLDSKQFLLSPWPCLATARREAGEQGLCSSRTPPVQGRVRNRLAGWKVHCKLSCLFLLLNLSDIWLTLLWTQPPRPPSSHPSPAGSCQPKTPPLIPFSLTLPRGAGAGTQGQARSRARALHR